MRKTLSILILAFLAIGTVSAQTADDIAKRYVEAIGGAKKWKAIKSQKIEFKLSTQGIELPGTMIGDHKNRERTEISFNGMNIIQAFDGQTPWSVSPPEGITTPTKMTGPQAESASDVVFLDEFIDYKSRGYTLALQPDETLNDKTYSKVKMVDKNGKQMFFLFDKETGLMAIKREQGLQGKTDTHYTNYQDVEGVKVPMQFEVKSGGMTLQKIELSEVTFNVEVTDEMFAFPGK